MATTAKSRQQETYDRLRADILNGVFAPGERLRFNEICSRYDVSVGLIRETLSRLVEQGLITVTHQTGFTVMSLSQADLRDLTFTLRSVSGLAIRHAVNRHDTEWESEVLAAHHRLASCKLDESSKEWSQLHTEFHEALMLGCGSERLSGITRQLSDSAEVYGRWAFASRDRSERDVAAEHRAIVDAVLAGDAELAGELLESHIEKTSQMVLGYLAADSERPTEDAPEEQPAF